jgi:hypothetical protein
MECLSDLRSDEVVAGESDAPGDVSVSVVSGHETEYISASIGAREVVGTRCAS